MVIAKPEMKSIEDPQGAIDLERPSPMSPNPGEQRFVLNGISWDGYLKILDGLPQTRAVRLTYDDGMLEFAMPLEKHELFLKAMFHSMNFGNHRIKPHPRFKIYSPVFQNPILLMDMSCWNRVHP